MSPLVTPRRLAAWLLFVALMAGVAAALGVLARGYATFETVSRTVGRC